VYVQAPQLGEAGRCKRHQRWASRRMAFWIVQRSLTLIHVRRIAQAHGASARGRTWLWHTPMDELDAGPRFATNALDQAVCMGISKSL
jgi:hypothetical protein